MWPYTYILSPSLIDMILTGLAGLKLGEDDTLSEADRDTLAPLPPPSGTSPWGGPHMPYAGTYVPPATGFTPMPFNYTNESFAFNRDGSTNSGSGNTWWFVIVLCWLC